MTAMPLVALEAQRLDRFAERAAVVDRVKWVLAIPEAGHLERDRQQLGQIR